METNLPRNSVPAYDDARCAAAAQRVEKTETEYLEKRTLRERESTMRCIRAALTRLWLGFPFADSMPYTTQATSRNRRQMKISLIFPSHARSRNKMRPSCWSWRSWMELAGLVAMESIPYTFLGSQTSTTLYLPRCGLLLLALVVVVGVDLRVDLARRTTKHAVK